MSFGILSVLFLVVASPCFVNGDEATCGCQPQPTIIQLSCGKGGSAQEPMRPPPPPPPPFHSPAPVYNPPTTTDNYYPEETTAYRWNLAEDMDRARCSFDQGHPVDITADPHHPKESDLKFPSEFFFDYYSNTVYSGNYPAPSRTWDGYPDTLGYPMPAKGTTHYNMLLCFPYEGAYYPNAEPMMAPGK